MFVLLLAVDLLRAQYPPLAPTVNTTIVVPAGALHYSSINIPAGVTVRFVAPGVGPASIPGMPTVLRCDGDAIVHGTLSLAGDFINDSPAGWVTTGQGTLGLDCGTPGAFFPPTGGRHNYGSIFPFSLEGGSPGGVLGIYTNFCSQFVYSVDGGDGGGTLVLLASGRIEVHGTVTANGQDGFFPSSLTSSGAGSGGSILLRGDAGVRVFPGASVTASGGFGVPTFPPYQPGMCNGSNGNIRIDAWGAPPVIQGTVYPTPSVVELPFLRALSQPNIGTTWTLQVFAPDTGWVYVAAALGPSSGTPTPFGLVGIDLATSARIALLTPQSSHDPYVTVQWPIPNTASLVGFAMWLQAIAVPQSLPARVTNTIAVVVQ